MVLGMEGGGRRKYKGEVLRSLKERPWGVLELYPFLSPLASGFHGMSSLLCHTLSTMVRCLVTSHKSWGQLITDWTHWNCESKQSFLSLYLSDICYSNRKVINRVTKRILIDTLNPKYSRLFLRQCLTALSKLTLNTAALKQSSWLSLPRIWDYRNKPLCPGQD